MRAYQHTFGLPTLTTNCSNNYGPRQFPEKLIPLMVTNALLGRELPVYGEGTNVRDWLFVEDHARALTMLVEKGVPGESYNIGGRSEQTNLQVVETICNALDELAPTGDARPHNEKIRFVADRPGHDYRYAINAQKIEREIGWKPVETFATGIERTVRWYLDNEDWWRGLRAARYDGERLGLAATSATTGAPGARRSHA